MNFNKFIIISAGAIIGSSLRYIITLIPINLFAGSSLFLIAVINIIGSSIIGLISCYSLSEFWQLFCVVGLLGSFTTFSSFSAGFFKLLEQSISLAFIYFFISILGSFLGFCLMRYITLRMIS